MSRKRDIEQRMMESAEEIRQSELPAEASQEIADRVWNRLEGRSADAVGAAELETIRGCADYQKLIPAYLSGDLAPSRSLLLEDHARHCVPCRKALKAARAGDAVAASHPVAKAAAPRRAALRWAAVAALVFAAIATGYLTWTAGPDLPYGAIVESTGNGLYRAASHQLVEVGAELAVGEAIRSAPGESAFLRLADGSRLEVRGRSELAIESRRGTNVRVERGSVIVEAAPQDRGRLYVTTDDCLVSVKGTIFAVSHGTKGSSVSVIEGEVHVDYAGSEQVLLAGDRTNTFGGFVHAGGGLGDEIAWSHNVDRYLALLGEVMELRQALARDLPRPGLRYSSRLVDLMPAEAAFYAAFPNLAETFAETERIVQERLAESALLSEWWEQQAGESGVRQHLEMLSDMMREAGGSLGDEIALTAAMSGEGEPSAPLLLAELVDPASLRSFLEEQNVWFGGVGGSIVFLDEVDSVTSEGSESEASSLVVWLGTDTLVASPNADLVRTAAAQVEGRVAAPELDPFRRALADAYRSGAEILVAADLQRAAACLRGENEARVAFEMTGLAGARHMILQRRRIGERAHDDAVLVFDGERRGVAGWLAEPAPMGSLRYVSPDAKLAASVVLTRPAEIVDEMLAMVSEAEREGGDADAAQRLEDFEREIGASLRDDIAAALGGEVTIALDGPVVPEPAWKVVVEVYDPDKLIWGLQQIVARVNDARREEGAEILTWSQEEAAGRTYYSVGSERMTFSFDDGYLIAAPNRALIDRAIRFRESGYSLPSSARFSKLLPADGGVNFSALVYQDALELLNPLAEKIAQGQLTQEQRAAIDSLLSQSEPTLAYAYGEPNRIVFAARGVGELFASGVPGLIGPSLFGLDFDAHDAPVHEAPAAVDRPRTDA